MKSKTSSFIAAIALFLAGGVIPAYPQQIEQQFKNVLKWRNVGPFRGGRTRAIAGVPSQPNVFYMAQVNGGVFKTTDFGRIWEPIFDSQPTGSVGSIAVSVSNPNVVYVGSGEGLHRPDLSIGDGVYKSTDAGKTWTHLNDLRDGQQIPQIAVDPRNPDRLFVAVAGHPYGPNTERGIFRSVNGGKTFEKVLYKDENTGASDVAIDPANPQTVYAALWESREGPWENARWDGTGGGIYKSTDGGKTWDQLAGGLPTGIIQVNLSVSASNTKRLIAAVATSDGVKLYRTDDGGKTWIVITDDPRPAGRIGGGDLPVPRIDPKNSDVIYSASTVSWKSVDGGKTWNAFRGAPGGDDYQNVWINPNNSEIILMGSDQGAIVTVNGGKTWSSWYNQPTAQMYHVNADNDFPYHICSGQQESGSACISSRGNDGQINFRDWHPVAAEEYGYVVPDPLDPNIIYGGKLTRYDRRTAQAQNILPRPFRAPDYRMIRTEPIVFSPVDPHTMFFAANTLWKTRDGGQNWDQISPDLTRKTFELPASIGKYNTQPSAQVTQRGVIYTIAPSFQNVNQVWVGTDDGLIYKTSDGGKNWSDITPPQITPWQKISIIDAGHFDSDTAHAAVNTIRLDDIRPHIYRTHDSGKTWKEIVNGIPAGQTVNVVREDPQRKGMLFAGTERQVYVSFDDGDNWQPLRFNMPATSVRDLIVKDDDLVVGTHGRGFWIMDNITPLRQTDASQSTKLFRPQAAIRLRWNNNTDTPIPPDEPSGDNPPEGAVIDYQLADGTKGPVVLEIKDVKGNLVRKYSSDDKLPEIPKDLRIPPYWVRPQQRLSDAPGAHRFYWDMHYTPVPGVEPAYPISAIYQNTAPDFTSPWVVPGEYTVLLTSGGKTYSETLTVKMDPRIKTPYKDLAQQFDLSYQLYRARMVLEPINEDLGELTRQLAAAKKLAGAKPISADIEAFEKKLAALTGNPNARPGGPLSLAVLPRIETLFGNLQDVDLAPTVSVAAATAAVLIDARQTLDRWKDFEKNDLPQIRQKLKDNGLPGLNLTGKRQKDKYGKNDEEDKDDSFSVP